MNNNVTIILRDSNAEEFSFDVPFTGTSTNMEAVLDTFNRNKPVAIQDLEVSDVEYIGEDYVAELSDTLIARMPLSAGDSIIIADLEDITDAMDEYSESISNRNSATTSAEPANTVAYVTVKYGAGVTHWDVAIVPGITTIEEIVTSSVTLARLGKTRDAVLRCKFSIEGVERTANYAMRASDILHIEDRIAGDKGSASCIVIEFANGESVTIASSEDTLTDAVANEWSNFPVMESDDVRITAGNFASNIESIEGIVAPGLRDRLYSSLALDEGVTIVMKPEVTVRSTVEFHSETARTPAATYTCTICLGSGINPFVRSFRQGATLSEVLFDPTVLARLNQRESDVRNSKVTVNGVEHTNFNVLLDNEAEIRIEARVAGDKGL